jgi:hypothetical protein
MRLLAFDLNIVLQVETELPQEVLAQHAHRVHTMKYLDIA